MSINITNFNRLSELISLSSRRKPKIVINPEGEYCIKPRKGYSREEDLNTNIVCDKTEWKISEEFRAFVDELRKNSQLSNEDKILLIYERLCKDYIYDDNILSYLQKYDDDKYGMPDFYGLDPDSDWEENRETHNRRVCYELSRYLAKALMELFKNNDNFSMCILYDKDLSHYFVGLTCDEYSITLDLDDFYKIKDLTRVKAGLTVEGIVILDDDGGKFKSALDKFNKGRSKHAIKKIDTEIEDTTISNPNVENQSPNPIEESDDIVFLRNAIEILKEKFDIDSQGLYEYIKEIVDIKLGPDARKKVWKKLPGKSSEETRYTRCLVIDVDGQQYMIDVDEKILRPFDSKEFTTENADFIPYKALSRDWGEHYDGT